MEADWQAGKDAEVDEPMKCALLPPVSADPDEARFPKQLDGKLGRIALTVANNASVPIEALCRNLFPH
jgi:hypothetical protein